jgi:hypothetical protein
MKKDLRLSIALLASLLLGSCSMSKQISIEKPDQNGNTLLHTAVRNDNLDVIKQLILMGANVNAKSPDGLTPLIIASQQNSLKSVTLLLEADVDVNLADNKKHSALFYAIDNYSKLTTGFTISKVNPNFSVDWRVGSSDLVKKLIDKGAYINHPEYKPLEDENSSKELRIKCAVAKVKVFQLQMPCSEHVHFSFDKKNSETVATVKSILDSCQKVKHNLIPTFESYLEESCSVPY